jgi:hypothetical protein
MLDLKSIEWFFILGRGDVAVVEINDELSLPCSHFIDGILYEIIGIETKNSKYYPQKVGLLVNKKNHNSHK